MWLKYSTAVFRVKLYSDKPWVIRYFDHFDQASIGIKTHSLHACLFKTGQKAVVEFVTVTMSLGYFRSAVCFIGIGIFFQVTGIRSQTHGASFVNDAFLLIH